METGNAGKRADSAAGGGLDMVVVVVHEYRVAVNECRGEEAKGGGRVGGVGVLLGCEEGSRGDPGGRGAGVR